MDLPSEPVDFLIIGGGSAGYALVAWLSEDTGARLVAVTDANARVGGVADPGASLMPTVPVATIRAGG
jgi:cation diffusion facilitator CzcD-associated flavoprotein CzcO